MIHGVSIKSPAELEMVRRAGRFAAEALYAAVPHVVAGTCTEELDRICHEYIVSHGAIPANLGYQGYPKTILTSINEVVCHGIPSRAMVLKDGDILNIDIAVIKDGWYGDTSRMFFVGTPSAPARRLVRATYDAMCAGIRQVRPGAALGDIGHAIQQVAQRERCSVVREYCGHGIGRAYHEDPQVLNHDRRGQGIRLRPGMVFTIEPMLNAGARGIRHLPDGWTVETADGSLSAQWEHMVAVTPDGYEVLTPWPDGLGSYPPP